MKKLFLLLAVVTMVLPSCSNINDAIEGLDNRVNNLEEEVIPSVDEQISAITTSINDLEALDNALKQQIENLEDCDDATAEEIAVLKAKDAELLQMIETLREYVNLLDQGTKDWASATFATLELYNTLTAELALLKAAIESCKSDAATTLSSAISSLDSSLKAWIGEQLAGYSTVAEIDAKISALQQKIADSDKELLNELNNLKSLLESTKNELSDAYQKAIDEAIKTNNGVINTKIANEIAIVNKRINDEVTAINNRLNSIENRLDALEDKVNQLFSRIQSVSYIPAYSDGRATMKYYGNISQITLDFKISPKEGVAELAEVWEKVLSCDGIYTQTRTISFVDMPITSFETNLDNGTISIIASGENLSNNVFTGSQEASVALVISDGHNSITSDYISIVAKSVTLEELIAPNNQIWYTSTERKVITPSYVNLFGANIVSNTYMDNIGIIEFDKDITRIGAYAFDYCLESVSIPYSVTEIGSSAFSGCNNLTSVIIPNSVTSIGENAFSYCESLTSVTIGNGVTEIGSSAFSNCSNLKHFYGKFASADNRCLIIDDVLHSFAPASLAEYTIPNGVISIGVGVFAHCNSLISVTIPVSVTSIGDVAFYGCQHLKSITIPQNVTKIGGYAFRNCYCLTSVYCKATNPPSGALFMFGSERIYVPASDDDSIINAYKNAEYWNEYAANIVEYDFLAEQ